MALSHRQHQPLHSTLWLCIVVGVSVLLGCAEKHDHSIPIHRLEKVLFSTPLPQLHDALVEHQDEFDTPLLHVMTEDPLYMSELSQFVSDPIMRDIYHLVDSIYPDLSWAEKEIGNALDRLNKDNAFIDVNRVYSYISGDYTDYDKRVYTNGIDVVIALDHYSLGYMGKYGYFNMPLFIQRLCQKEYLVSDIIATMVKEYVEMPETELSLIDYIIMEGKVQYLQHVALPKTNDSILFRYTHQQMQWMTANEGNVWSYLLQNNLLYSTDQHLFHNMIDEAPHTNAFGDNSAPRTISYIGWHIVQQYMKKSKSSIDDLLHNTDSKEILSQSGYHPK